MAAIELDRRVGNLHVALVQYRNTETLGRYRVTLREEGEGETGRAWAVLEFANHDDAFTAYKAIVAMVHFEAGANTPIRPRA